MPSLSIRQDALPPAEAERAKQILLGRPGYLIRRLNQIHYALFFEECGHENVTPVQYGVLTAVKVRPGIDQTEIGAYLGLDRTTTADVVRRLEGKGFLRRQIDPRDRRARQVFITDAGLRITEDLLDGMVAASDRMLQPLDTERRRLFLDLLTELVDANDAYGRGRQARV